MSQLQLSLLGVPIIRHGEDTLTFPTRKALALLVYLTVEGGVHTRKSLSEAFWPELDAEHGRASLRATLLELRKLLGERSHNSHEQAHLLIKRDMLALNQDNPPFLDLHQLKLASEKAKETGVDTISSVLQEQFEQATKLVRGSFMASFTLRDSQFFDDWTRQQRESWYLCAQQLFDSLSHLYERAGKREQAIDIVQRWLAFDPLSEEGYRCLMRLRFALGDRVGALRAYATCRTVLADELEIEPEAQTIALAEHLRHTTPFSQISSYPSIEWSSTYLLDIPLLGRNTEFNTLVNSYQCVHSDQPHFVLLQGERGIGKTRLANEFVSWAQVHGASVIAGRVLLTGRQLPYQPFIDILRTHLKAGESINDRELAELIRLLPELHDRFPHISIPLIDKKFGNQHLFEAITRIIRQWSTRRPLVLLLDDIQWADTATLDLLLYLAHSLAERPAPVLLLLNLRTEAEGLLDQQPMWLQALKRTHIPLTIQNLTSFTKEETLQFVRALPWAEQPLEMEKSRSTNQCFDTDNMLSLRQDNISSLTNWLYIQTQGQPFYLTEMLKGLLEREIILPSLQENGKWGLVLKFRLLAGTPASELIPVSVRELIGCQLSQLSSQARAFLIAAAVTGAGLTFEQLCLIAQVDEQIGLHALEELVRNGLLCEEKYAEGIQALNGYGFFPNEMLRNVVYQEAGATRQRLLKQRAWLVLQEEVECERRFATIRYKRVQLGSCNNVSFESKEGLGMAYPPKWRREYRVDLQRGLQQAIDLLPSKVRLIVCLHSFGQMTFVEIGQRLNMQESTVKTYFYRSLALLRRTLASNYDILSGF